MRDLLFAIFGFALLGSCRPDPPPCPLPYEKWVAVGFYRSAEPDPSQSGSPIDTSFTSVYPLGNNAELAQRRLNNSFMLPIPHAGGRVDYVFRQDEKQGVLSLFFTTSTSIDADECGVFTKVNTIDVLAENTTLGAEHIQKQIYLYYDNERAIVGDLAVFVP